MTAPKSKGPSWWYLALAPLFLAIGLGVAAWCVVHFVTAVAGGTTRFDGPGEFQITLDKPGKYEISQEYPENQSPVFDGSPERPYPICTVTSADGKRTIQTSYSNSSVKTTINQQTRSPMYEFTIDQPGAYRITSRRGNEADGSRFMMRVGPEMRITGPAASIFVGPPACCCSIVLAIAVVVIVLVKRNSASTPPSYPAATPFPPISAPPPGEQPPVPPKPEP